MSSSSSSEFYGNSVTGSVEDAALANLADKRGVTVMDNGKATESVNFDSVAGNGGNGGGKGGESDGQGNLAAETGSEVTLEGAGENAGAGIQGDIEKHLNAVDELKNDLSSKGFNFDGALAEYEANGTLSAETMEALNKAGYPKAVVEGFIQSRQVLETQYTDAVMNLVGGAQSYQQMTQWAASNLSKAEISAFDKAIDSGDINTVRIMVNGVKAQMAASKGTFNASLLGGASSPSQGRIEGFKSKADMVKAMSDKRYARDPAYTREVEQKVMVSSWY